MHTLSMARMCLRRNFRDSSLSNGMTLSSPTRILEFCINFVLLVRVLVNDEVHGLIFQQLNWKKVCNHSSKLSLISWIMEIRISSKFARNTKLRKLLLSVDWCTREMQSRKVESYLDCTICIDEQHKLYFSCYEHAWK